MSRRNYIQRPPLNPHRPLPKRSCIRCFKGNVDTFVIVYGDEEWVAGSIIALTKMSDDEAIGTVEAMRRQHKAKPGDRHLSPIRICAECAAASNVGKRLPLYTEADVEEGGQFDGIIQTDEHTRRALGHSDA